MTFYELLHSVSTKELKDSFFSHPESYQEEDWDYFYQTYKNLKKEMPSLETSDMFFDMFFIMYSEDPVPENPDESIFLCPNCSGIKNEDYSNPRSTVLISWSDCLACTIFNGSLEVYGNMLCLLAIIDELSFMGIDDACRNEEIEKINQELEETMETFCENSDSFISYSDLKKDIIEKSGGEEIFYEDLYHPYGKEVYNERLDQGEVFIALIKCGLTLENQSYTRFDFTKEECLIIREFLKEGKMGFDLLLAVSNKFPNRNIFSFINIRKNLH